MTSEEWNDIFPAEEVKKNSIPQGATNLECFAIKNGEAYIGYKLANGNFEYVQIPYTEE